MRSSINRKLVRICLFAALIAALGLLPRIDIPVAAGVPVTAQTLGVMLAGLILGSRAGALAVLLFVAIVALGMPFLAGGRGGLAVFAGPTAGFLLGWIPGAFVAGLFASSQQGIMGFMRALTGAVLGGIAVVYACGIAWLAFSGMTPKAAALASAIFLPGDIFKAVLAAWLSGKVARYLPGPRS